MKREDIFIAVGEVEERFLKESEDYRGNKSIYVWTSAIAACLAFAFVALALLNSFLNPTLPPPISDPIPTYNGSFMLNAAVYPENISGISASKLVFDGSGAQMPSGSAPLRYFKVDSFVVKAELVEELPDTYTKFGSTSAMKVVKLRTLEVIYGKNVPDEFFYIMFNNTSCKDLSKADTVIISMEQCGMENYVLRNVEENSAEALSLLVFECSTGTDNIIFFKNGICVAKDSPYLTEEQKERMISYNGCTEEYTLSMIKKILADPDGMEEIYYYGVQKEPYAISCNNIDGSKAREVLDYVKPFENGVFAQTFIKVPRGTVRYTRYINDCVTNEVITLNTVTGDIDYDGERFVTKDLEKLENISMHIEKLAEVYEIEPPKPPHTNEKGKKLLSVDMRAYYVKIDGAVYGVLGIIWEYCKIGHKNIRYYDDRYVLFADGKAMLYEKDVLYAQFGIASDMAAIVSKKEYEKEYLLMEPPH